MSKRKYHAVVFELFELLRSRRLSCYTAEVVALTKACLPFNCETLTLATGDVVMSSFFFPPNGHDKSTLLLAPPYLTSLDGDEGGSGSTTIRISGTAI